MCNINDWHNTKVGCIGLLLAIKELTSSICNKSFNTLICYTTAIQYKSHGTNLSLNNCTIHDKYNTWNTKLFEQFYFNLMEYVSYCGYLLFMSTWGNFAEALWWVLMVHGHISGITYIAVALVTFITTSDLTRNEMATWVYSPLL